MQIRRSLRPLLPILGLSLAFGGCSLIPPYLLPKFDTSSDYHEAVAPVQADLPWKVAATQALPQAPWQIFDLPELPELLGRLESANASLALSQARYNQAAALIDQATAGLFPAVSGNAGVTRARNNGTTSNTATTNSISLSSNWEIDLWGRLRATVDANEASAKASAADLAGVRLALQAQLVQSLLSLRIVEVQRNLLDATVADYERYLQLTNDRIRFGVASRADQAQAETQLRSAQAQAVETGVQRAQLEHAIAVLVGELPANFKLPAPPAGAPALRAQLRGSGDVAQPGSGTTHASIFDLVPALPTVPLSAPSTLLERRPDIAAAERRAAAANAQVGVARAAFFPVLSLTGTAGQRSTALSDLLTAPARFWSIGPSLVAPLFDAGLRSSQKAQAVAVWEQSTASYRQTVLAAFQEVEDQLSTLRILADEAKIQDAAVKAARVSAELTQAQYRAGVASSLQVIVANSALLTAERSALDLHNRRLSAAVVLIRALGGGWPGTGEAAG
ncbi:MAG: transporter [Proteobacteria bacterium]|nr:transporter [Pseudomonadota bacterium]